MSTHHSLFSLYDLFVVGIGFDLAGAILLAFGLLRRPHQLITGGLNQRAGDYDAQTIRDLAYDRVDARSGVIALVAGFLAQGVGYVIYLSKTVVVDPTTGKAVAAAIQGAATVVIVLGLHFLLRRRLARRTIVAVARAYDGGGPWSGKGARMLVQVARAAGWLSEDRHSFVAKSDDLPADLDREVEVARHLGRPADRQRLRVILARERAFADPQLVRVPVG